MSVNVPQKLEPSRDKLSESAASRSSAGGAKTGSYLPRPQRATPRTCSLCGVQDAAQVIPGEFDGAGNQKIEHSVTVELRYLKAATETEALKQVTPHLARYGWRYKFFQGRHAMERFICRPCLREREVMALDWAKKARGDQPRRNSDKFYATLCGD